MGVGVFRSDFYETGDSFIISPFNAYSEEENEDQEELYVIDLKYILTHIGSEIGFSNKFLQSFAMDSDFEVLSENDYVQIGIRGWESDIIVGVAAISESYENITEQHENLLDEYKVPLNVIKEDYNNLSKAVFEYTIISLQESGYEVSNGSGYTTGVIEEPKNFVAAKDNLKEIISTIEKKLDSRGNLSETMNSELRSEMIKDLYDYNDFASEVKAAIPYLNTESDEIILIDTQFGDEVNSVEYTEDLINDSSDLMPIQYSDKTKNLFESLQNDDGLVIISEEELMTLNPEFTPPNNSDMEMR